MDNKPRVIEEGGYFWVRSFDWSGPDEFGVFHSDWAINKQFSTRPAAERFLEQFTKTNE